MEQRHLVSLETARIRLTVVWTIGTALVLTVVIVQSIMNHYGSETQEVWEWLLPTVMPSLGVIVSSLISSAFDPLSASAFVRSLFYRVALSVSLFYLALVLLSILLQPFTDLPPIQLMHRSSLWLGPLQGLAGGSLGVLFASKQHSRKLDKKKSVL
jgi:hypothetical protein